MHAADLVAAERLLDLFHAIEPELYKFPAVDAKDLRRRVEEWVTAHRGPSA